MIKNNLIFIYIDFIFIQMPFRMINHAYENHKHMQINQTIFAENNYLLIAIFVHKLKYSGILFIVVNYVTIFIVI